MADDAMGCKDALETAGLKAKDAEVAWLFVKGLAGIAVWEKPVPMPAIPAGNGALEGCAAVA